MAAYQAATPNDDSVGDVWDDLEKMNDDVELLCEKLSAVELGSLSDALGGPGAVDEDVKSPICVEALASPCFLITYSSVATFLGLFISLNTIMVCAGVVC